MNKQDFRNEVQAVLLNSEIDPNEVVRIVLEEAARFAIGEGNDDVDAFAAAAREAFVVAEQ